MEMPREEVLQNLRKFMRIQTVLTAIQAYNCFGTFTNKVVFALAICSFILMAIHLWATRIFVLFKQSSSTIVPCIYSSAVLVVFLTVNLIIILVWESNSISGHSHLEMVNYLIFVIFSAFGILLNFASWRISIYVKEKFLAIEAGTADDQGRVFESAKGGQEP